MATTLKAMQDSAAPDDRGSPALRRYPEAVQRGGERSRYIRYEFRARTLAELEAWARDDGAAAVADAQHHALTTYQMNSAHSTAADCSAVVKWWEHLRSNLNTPKLTRHPWRSSLSPMSPADRQGIEDRATRALSEWQAAGSPHLTGAIEHTQQLIHSARMAAEDRQAAREAVEQILKGS
jgi:hypothetical protein